MTQQFLPETTYFKIQCIHILHVPVNLFVVLLTTIQTLVWGSGHIRKIVDAGSNLVIG